MPTDFELIQHDFYGGHDITIIPITVTPKTKRGHHRNVVAFLHLVYVF